MEERIIERDREIRIKRKNGETDAEDALAEETSAEEEGDIVFELPEGEEYDEDLVGLTPSQLKAELARREKEAEEARKESERLVGEAEKCAARGEFATAAALYAQARVYDADNEEAKQGYWSAMTGNFTTAVKLYEKRTAKEFAAEEKEVRAFVLGRLGDAVSAERETCRKQEAELAPEVEEKQAERRKSFAANRKYYSVRLVVSLVLLLALAIAVAISADNIVRTTSVVPLVLTIVFAVLAFAALVVSLVFTRKFLVAYRYCRNNEDLASTEEGAQLLLLRERIEAIGILLGESDGKEED